MNGPPPLCVMSEAQSGPAPLSPAGPCSGLFFGVSGYNRGQEKRA